MVVTPPTAALGVSEAMSSDRGRKLPGWVCGSTSPGRTYCPMASSVSCAGGRVPGAATAATRPSAMPTSAGNVPSVVTSVPFTTARSSITDLPAGLLVERRSPLELHQVLGDDDL